MLNTFFWYDLATSDVDAARKFYCEVVGWGYQDNSQAGQTYGVFTVGDAGVAGLMPYPEGMTPPFPVWNGYIAVDDVDAKAEQVTNDEWEDWFPHFSPNGKLMLVFSFPKGTKTHNDKMEGVKLRLLKAPGKNLKTADPQVLSTFFGGQGTINVNSWSPDSGKFAYVVYEPIR